MYRQVNLNPQGKNVGDCTIRAISAVLDMPWYAVYVDICIKGLELCDMPSSNDVWGRYLLDKGYTYTAIPNQCPFCYTVKDFCREHSHGSFVIGTGTHVVAVIGGDYYDTWDSGEKVVLYYFERG
jgi:hypothetical protein